MISFICIFHIHCVTKITPPSPLPQNKNSNYNYNNILFLSPPQSPHHVVAVSL